MPYLDLEIDAIDPEVIVLIGDAASSNFASRYPVSFSSKTYNDIFKILHLNGTDIRIVRSYHWSHGIPMENLSVDNEKTYWKKLGETVDKALKS